MEKIKIGVQLYTLRKYIKDAKSLAEVFKRCKTLGAEVVQLSGGASVKSAELKRISEDNALPICITHSPYKRIVDDLNRLAEEHLEFNCKNIGIGMMPQAFRTGKLDDISRFVEMLNITAEKLKPYGMTIAYHNHDFEFKKADEKIIFDYMIENTLHEVQFIPDTFWIKVGGYEPQCYIERLKDRINTLHLKDYKKTFCLPVFRSIGKGNLNFDDILACAEKANVQNAVFELDISPNPYKSVEFSLNYLKKIY
ncbi:MAG: sugar phosphate isomerase/epimerase [Clostridia bacterium]|nr:sugar phosphate isomerase/epimerase [Clostridia bacterium]